MSNINYCEAVQKFLTDDGFHFTTKEFESGVVLSFGVTSKSLPGINYSLTIDKGGNAKLRSYIVSNLDASKTLEMLEQINTLNSNYRFTVFNLDADNDLCVTYDYPLYGDEKVIGNLVSDSIYFVSRIIDECAPDIMKIVWRKEDESTEFIDNDDMFSE